MARTLVSVMAVLVGCIAPAQSMEVQGRLNPVRKVVNLLQAMQKKVQEEGEKEQELHDKFMCYCSEGKKDLEASIAAAEEKGPSTVSNIEASEGRLAQAKEDLKSAQSGRDDAKSAIAEANALREKESKAFASYKSDADANVAAVEKAIAALERGVAGGFLQTGSAQQVLKLAQQSGSDLLVDADRQELVAFLSGSSSSAYAPQSGEIVGILKQMHETMAGERADEIKEEEEAIKSHGQLIAAKSKEAEALSSTVETKTSQIGELGIAIVQMKEDLSDSQAALLADRKFLKELDSGCSKKAAEWEERTKTRAEELVALADTIKVLNDDDALSLFKRTLPSAGASSLLQVQVSNRALRADALKAIRSAERKAHHGDRVGFQMLLLAMTGKKSLSQGGFDKVITMVDEMVEVLIKEQQDDDNKKEYCASQFDMSDDEKKALERKIEDTTNLIATAEESVAALADEIAALEAGIKALDRSVAEATEQRKAENSECKELLASDTAAKEVLGFAKNRLNKFYNPKLFKEAPKRELSAEGRIEASMSGTEPPTEAPTGIAGTGISAAFVQVSMNKEAPAPPPETFGAYSKKSEESTGVIAMIDLLIRDLDKELTEAKTDEKNAQEEYEVMMEESKEKRAADAKSLAEKEGTKADIEAELQKHKSAKKTTVRELMAVEKYIASLHAECDWLVQYHEVRKQARTDEVDSLKKAKAVLSGAEYSLVQTHSHHFLSKRVA